MEKSKSTDEIRGALRDLGEKIAEENPDASEALIMRLFVEALNEDDDKELLRFFLSDIEAELRNQSRN